MTKAELARDRAILDRWAPGLADASLRLVRGQHCRAGACKSLTPTPAPRRRVKSAEEVRLDRQILAEQRLLYATELATWARLVNQIEC